MPDSLQRALADSMRILIVDDHPIVAEAATIAIGALRPDAQVDSISCIEDLDRTEHRTPDLVLLDLTLPGCSGLDALDAVVRRWPSALVVIFSATNDSACIRQALASGARGFIPKTSPHKLLIDALRLVLDGGTYVPPDILKDPHPPASDHHPGHMRVGSGPPPPPARAIAVGPAAAAESESAASLAGTASIIPPAPTIAGPVLSARQRQIAELLAQGLTTKEICRVLGISPNTVKTHVAGIFRALGVRNRVQAVAVTQAWLHRQPLQ